MRVMVIVKATQASEKGVMPTPDLLAAMGKFNQELIAAGVMLDGAGLRPSAKGVRMHFSGKERSLTYGPFDNTEPLASGYWLWKVKSLDDAIDWLRRAPMPDGSDLEIRPLFEMEDFAPA
ncbi:MAG TPA: YciI family protein [Rhizomicrobium sp.]|nr:YciI family protein [Rhizomicrobium sp.]HWC63597.1 YciI family protein [Rhizomicrobium sp.]